PRRRAHVHARRQAAARKAHLPSDGAGQTAGAAQTVQTGPLGERPTARRARPSHLGRRRRISARSKNGAVGGPLYPPARGGYRRFGFSNGTRVPRHVRRLSERGNESCNMSRPVKKKIGVQHLRLGMYVSELDRPWIESRFLFQGFEIRTQEELDELLRLCKYVYVETDVEYKDGQVRPRQPVPVGTPDPNEFAAKRIGLEIIDKFNEHHRGAPPRYTDRASLEEELPQARALVKDTKVLVDSILEDARLGRSLDSATAKKSVGGMVESVLRNPDALIWFNELKNKDAYTSEHSMRVCVLALTFGRHLELSEDELNILGIGALLHDVGKMQVPAEIINKPGRLSAEEFELMKSHVPRGVEILDRTPGIPAAAIDVARSHHERFDGSGYATGLKGEQISLFGQIGAIVDSYDAITSDRSYHKGMSPHDALR